MSGLFESKTTNQTVTQESDPWKNMPKWMKEAYKQDEKRRDNLMKQAWDVDHETAELTGREKGAVKIVSNARRAADDMTADGVDYLDETRDAADAYRDQGADYLEDGMDAADAYRDRGTAYFDTARRTADRRSGSAESIINGLPGAIDDYTDQYTSEYTDDVVDTTLAGMAREAQRERLRREAQSAAIGGTTNTRTAVADAVAQQLTGMNMGQTEAGLRDDAIRFASDMGMRRGDIDLNRAGALEDMANNSFARGSDYAGTMRNYATDVFGEGSEAAGLMDRYASSTYGQGSDYASSLSAIASQNFGRAAAHGAALDDLGRRAREIEQAKLDEGKRKVEFRADINALTNTRGAPPQSDSRTATEPVEKPSVFAQLMGNAAQAASIYAGLK